MSGATEALNDVIAALQKHGYGLTHAPSAAWPHGDQPYGPIDENGLAASRYVETVIIPREGETLKYERNENFNEGGAPTVHTVKIPRLFAVPETAAIHPLAKWNVGNSAHREPRGSVWSLIDNEQGTGKREGDMIPDAVASTLTANALNDAIERRIADIKAGKNAGFNYLDT